MSRRSPLCWRVHVALIAVAAALVLAAPAEAQGDIAGQLLATGGTVDIVVQPATALFTSQLFLRHPDGTRENISLSTEVGKHVTVGPFAAGQELVFGITVLNGWGQTEIGGEIVGWSAQDAQEFGETHLGAVGRAHENVELRISDLGEILVRTPMIVERAAAGDDFDGRLVDGWFRTGDLGRIDDAGFL